MPGASNITRTDALLAERERQGVRTLTAVRGLFILVMVVSHWVVGFSVFEKIAATVIGIPAFGLICVFFALLGDRRPVGGWGLPGRSWMWRSWAYCR